MNRKKVYRLWKQMGLSLPKRRSRRRSRKGSGAPLRAIYPNHVWTYDFMADTTLDERKLRILTVVDEFTRESVGIRVGRRMPALAVLAILEQLFAERGAPEYLRSDNGPEFIAQAVQSWVQSQGTKTYYIAPGSPWQNAYGESFNDKLRDECLNMEVFLSVQEAQIVVEGWRRHYNQERPHSSLGYKTPIEFRAEWEAGLKELSFSPAPSSLRSAGGGAGEKEKLLLGDVVLGNPGGL